MVDLVAVQIVGEEMVSVLIGPVISEVDHRTDMECPPKTSPVPGLPAPPSPCPYRAEANK